MFFLFFEEKYKMEIFRGQIKKSESKKLSQNPNRWAKNDPKTKMMSQKTLPTQMNPRKISSYPRKIQKYYPRIWIHFSKEISLGKSPSPAPPPAYAHAHTAKIS